MQDSGFLAVFKVTARDQGHYKGPSGAFVTYCNISFFCFEWKTPMIQNIVDKAFGSPDLGLMLIL